MVSAGKFFTLVVLSTLMGFSSYGAGLLPLSVPLTSGNIRSVSVLGMGVLVGTAMVIIIPEGVETLYNSELHKPINNETRTEGATPEESSVRINERESHFVGLFLLMGFMFMYFMDNIGVVAAVFGGASVKYVGIEAEVNNYLPSPVPSAQYSSFWSFLRSFSPKTLFQLLSSSPTSFGLIIHSMADGVAMGSSVSSSNMKLKGVIFIAIALHKIPAAFGLVSVLMSSNVHVHTIKLHLALFALAAPLGSWVTFLAIHLLGGSPGVIEWWTGALLLFSGGTFLYVAVHAMQDVAGQDGKAVSAGSDSTAVQTGLTISDFGISALGMVLPLLVASVRE
ncbi:hypothetical protein BABINDRAFT_160472 [Babjeviella inositovora NRRL Y-12698]|uniref:Zinc/iron permease n=1 Tax=Babjeviella inositovora NRRL Y-12698 TaxID=984486 RepID=A0A1E3QU22_9ASCO|nr:uncharacterized protein BABINDRAFT_160472 [Babjeviella inositovora NRRL Y-12698]ODQ81054.1 hypothetical protein BABINDRAFT_160472 [Babjeviella inositovora NRRL Y-12698]